MNYKRAEFAHWIPEKPKAVLVLVPGSSSDGRYMVGEASWLKWARRNNVALVGCFYEDIDRSRAEGYADASGGSGAALLTYLEDHGMKDLPILIWGFSAGGQFSYEFACYAPERVIGFIVNKGGYYYHALAPEATRKIPSIWFYGEFDDQHRILAIAGINQMNASIGAPWELVGEKVGHSPGNSEKLSREFFTTILDKRG